jgi:hypothetical protein
VGTKQLRNLTISHNDDGVYGTMHELANNTLTENRFALNLYADPGNGPFTVARNTISRTAVDGMTVSGPADLVLDRNVVTNSGQHGINIYAQPVNGNFVLSRNRTDRNGGDGIHSTDVPSVTFDKNEASFNGNLGIEAIAGVSGSKNRAVGNGNPAECDPGYLCSGTGKPKG